MSLEFSVIREKSHKAVQESFRPTQCIDIAPKASRVLDHIREKRNTREIVVLLPVLVSVTQGKT